MTYAPRTNEFQVNSNTAGDQTRPDVIQLSDGRYLVVWSSPTTAQNSQFLIRGQFYGADGSPIGGEMNLTALTIRGQFEVSATALPGGGFALSWARGTSSGTLTEIQFFNASGAQTSAAITLDGSGREPSLATLANGDVVAVWGDGDFNTGIVDVRGAIVSPSGAVQNFTIPTDGGGIRGEPDVTVLANGNFVVTWTESDADAGEPAGAGPYGVKAQIFSAAGVPIGGQLALNTTTAGLQDNSEVTALAGGGFVAVWTDASATGGDTSGRAIRGQVFDASGNKVGAEFLVNTTTTDDQTLGEVSAAKDGGFFVTWNDASASGAGSDRDIRGQQFAADGSKVGPEILVNTVTTGDQFVTGHTMGSSGDIFVAWSDYGAGDGSGSAVKARLYTEAFQGSDGAETIVGTAGDDRILAYGGNDAIFVQQPGSDTVDAGDGDDVIYFGPFFNNDRVDGGAGYDTLALQGQYGFQILNWWSFVNIEVLSLMTASDNVYGGAMSGNNSYGFKLDDHNVAAGQALVLEARALQSGEAVNFDGRLETDGKFALYGGRGNDTLFSGAGNDIIDGGLGADAMNGGLGDDIYFVDNAGDTVQDSGPGNDAIYTSVNFTLASNAQIELLATTNSGSTTGRLLTGNGFTQTIIGTNGADELRGGGGNDYLVGNGGNDVLEAGGFSILAGGTGDDTYLVDDWFQVLNESAGQGFDTVYTKGNFVLLGDIEVELLIYQGTAGVGLYGNGFAQTIRSGVGNDSIEAGGGNDHLIAYAGNDILDGGAGADTMEGGEGDDIYFVDQQGDTVVETGSGFDSVYVSASYALSASAAVELLATTASGAETAINLTGSNTAQTIIGTAGANTLLGLGGNDHIQGLAGNDVIDGGAGDDLLEGGAGADTFRFSAASDSAVTSGDQVRDFVSGTDKIDLSLIDANSNAANDQAFTYIGSNAFTGQAGQLRHEVANGQVYILGDIDGNGTADFQIVLNNTTIITAGDFIL